MPSSGSTRRNRALNDWENPAVVGRNRLPARATFIPFADEKTARAGDYNGSPWYRSLNGIWKFHYAETVAESPSDFFLPSFDTAGWDDLAVPSCWQMHGYG